MTRAAIVMPAYRAGLTLERSLACLSRQTCSDFEFVLVESGPDSSSGPLLDHYLPGSIHLRHSGKWLPHAAINRGLAHTSADVLVFLDADAYPRSDWLDRLLAAHADGHPVVAGGVDCYGKAWLSLAAHLAKFDKWLPNLPPRTLREAPTVNFLIDRSVYDAYGPFLESTIHADTAFCWTLGAAGVPVFFAPEAVVEHHHTQGWVALLKERYQRGLSFAEHFGNAAERDRRGVLHRVLISLLPVRLAHQLLRVGRNAWQSGYRGELLFSLPVSASLLYAWLLGEVAADLRQWFGKSTRQ